MKPLHSAYPTRVDVPDETLHNPYQYFGTVRALGLSAEADTLKNFLDTYLNQRLSGSGIQFDLTDGLEPTVIMVISDFYRITGEPNRGNFRNRSLQFHVPVTRYECSSDRNGEQGTLQVFSYASNMWNALTSTELRGPLTRHSTMRVRTWMEDLHADASPHTCYSMSPQVIGADGEVGSTVIVSVQKRNEALTPPDTKTTHWDIKKNLNKVFAIKQFQHQQYPRKTCYESLVEIGFDNGGLQPKIDWRNDGSDEGRLAKTCVRIRRDEAHPIVEKLGLKCCAPDEYESPEGKLRTLEKLGHLSGPSDDAQVCDYLLAPIFYQVMEAGAPVKKDAHEAVQQLATDHPVLNANSENGQNPIIEDGAVTLCYRYRTDLANKGWLKP